MRCRILVAFLLILLVMQIIPTSNVQAAKKNDYITIRNFVEKTMKATGIGTSYEDAVNAGIVHTDDFEDIDRNITNEEAALILNRTWNVKYGDTDDQKIKLKKWFLRPYYTMQLDIKDYVESNESDAFFLNNDFIEIIKNKQNEFINSLKEKYNEYTFEANKNFTITSIDEDGKSYTYEKMYNVETSYDTSYELETVKTYIITITFYLKDKPYQSNEYNEMINDIETNYNVSLVKKNAEYYSTNLTYGMMKDIIKNCKRIADIDKAHENNQESIYSMYSKGVMPGYSKGSYAMKRDFKPLAKTTLTEANEWIDRVAGKKALRTFTPEGMLVRVSNLPFNAKEWKYVLEDVPNEFYLMRYDYEAGTGVSCNNLYTIRKEAILPNKFYDTYHKWKGIEANRLDDIIKSVNENLELQLNLSYRNIDNAWKEAFYNSVTSHLSLFDMSTTYKSYDKNNNLISEKTSNSRSVLGYYLKYVKKHEVIISAKNIYIDPNSIYLSNHNAFIRCYVKFKVDWKGKIKDVNGAVFPGDYYVDDNFSRNSLVGLKKGKYIECLVDVPIDLNAPDDYEQGTSYGGIEVGRLKSMEYLKNPNDYKIVYIKSSNLKIIRVRSGGGALWWGWK